MRLLKPATLLAFVIFAAYFLLFKDLFLGGKVLFPSNFLAQFYSPYRTQTFQGWEQGIPHKPIGTDQIRFFAPSREFTIDEIKKGNLPFWNPYIFSGNPHIANFQSAVYSPFTLLFLILPFWSAWDLSIIIQPLLAALGMFLYLRYLNLSQPATLLGVLAFALSGFMTVWIYENSVVASTGLFLPYILFAFEKFVKERRFYPTLLLILFLVLTVYSGFFQLAFYIYIFTFVYMIVRFIQNKSFSIRAFLYIFIVFLTSLLLAAPQLVSSIQGYLISPRTKIDVWFLFETYLLSPLHFLKIVTPDLQGSPGSYNYFGEGFYHETVLFIGTVPFLVALFAFKNWKNRFVILYTTALFITLLLAFKSPFTEFFYSLDVPLLSTFVPSRIVILSTFFLSVLAAFGADMLLTAGGRYKTIIALLFFVPQILITFIGFLATQNNFILPQGFYDSLGLAGEYILRNSSALFRNAAMSLLIGTCFIGFVLLVKNKKILYGVIILLSSLQLLYFHQKYMVTGESEFLYPAHPALEYIRFNQDLDRTIAIGDSIQGNLLLKEKIYSPEGLDPIFPYEYAVLANSAKQKRYATDMSRIEVNVSDQAPSDIFLNEYLQKFLRLTSVKYVLYFTKEDTPVVPANLKLEKEDAEWKLYEMTDRLPRVLYADSVSTASGLEDSVKKTLDPFRGDGNIVLDTSIVPEFLPPEDDDIVGIAEYNTQDVLIRSIASGPRLLYLSDAYYPLWRAYVNDTETEVYRANTAFRAILVPAGDNIVEFKYDPMMSKYGVNMFIIGVLLVGIIWYSFNIKRE